MIFITTKKQYDLLVKIISIMKPFYRNDLHPLFTEIGHQYGVNDDAINAACDIFGSVPVTGAVPKYIKALEEIEQDVKQGKDIDVSIGKTVNIYHYVKQIEITGDTAFKRKVLIDTLDAYSRILMGQFFIIYEQLDINTDNEDIQTAWADAKWNGTGVQEMRTLLIPQMASFGWNGSYGISSPDNRYESKLAYEMLKVIRGDNAHDILKVTYDEPLIRLVVR